MKLSDTNIIKELIDERQTPKDITQRYKISKQAFYKRLRNMIKKGYLKKEGNSTYFKGKKLVEPTGSEKSVYLKSKSVKSKLLFPIRLHGQKLRIGFFHATEKYYKLLALLKTFKHKDFSVRLHKKCIQVFIDKSFIGVDPLDCKGKSLKFVLDLVPFLEKEYGVTLIKKGKHFIRVYQEEYAEQNNELAKESEVKKEKISIRDEKDGRIWLKVDKSFNLNELETCHPKKAYEDMEEVIQPFMKLLRQNPKILNTLSELSMNMFQLMNSLLPAVSSLVDSQKLTVTQINFLTEFLTLMFKGQKEKMDEKDSPVVGDGIPPYYVG